MTIFKIRQSRVWKTFHDFRFFWLFLQTSRTWLFLTVTDRLSYRNFGAWWVQKQLIFLHKAQRMGSALTCLLRYREKEYTFFTESWLMTRHGFISWMQRRRNCSNNGFTVQTVDSLFKQWIHIQSPNKPRIHSNKHFQIEKWWLQYSWIAKEFCWRN